MSDYIPLFDLNIFLPNFSGIYGDSACMFIRQDHFISQRVLMGFTIKLAVLTPWSMDLEENLVKMF